MSRYFYEGAQRGVYAYDAAGMQFERMAATDGYVLFDRVLGYNRPIGTATLVDAAQVIVDALNSFCSAPLSRMTGDT